MNKPVIGVAFGAPSYLSALRAGGAEIRELSPGTDRLPEALDGLDGVLLTGGPDVCPSHYDAATTHSTVRTDTARDEYELPLARAALASGLPMLAICRGVQVLNVAAGGTLIQDLPSDRPGGLDHNVPTPKTAIAHEVTVTPGSRLAAVVSPHPADHGRLEVNSRHHQAIDTVAPGFAVSAVAPDGTIEAIEQSGPVFCVGVQWHPEDFWRTGDTSLFEAFASAAAERIRRG